MGDTLCMWTLWFALLAQGAPTVLHVGVHQHAGTTHDIAVDGADGLCTVTMTQVTCPATNSLTFRWGPPGTEWTWVGDTVVEPGQTGTAWVMGPEDEAQPCLERLTSLRTDGGQDRAQWIRACAEGVGPDAPRTTRLLLDHFLEQALDPDPDVRVAVIDALVPLWRHTASDPYPPGSPSLIPEGLIARWATDAHSRVRRRLANRLRDVREPPLAEEMMSALENLTEDRRPVSRAAMKSMDVLALDERTPAVWAWNRAMGMVSNPGPPGRAAANTLAHLKQELEPSEMVVPRDAIQVVLSFHPERAWGVWYAWRGEVSFHRPWVDTLLRDTVGLSRRLLQHWAKTQPLELAEAIGEWESGPDHTERYREVCDALASVEELSSSFGFCL